MNSSRLGTIVLAVLMWLPLTASGVWAAGPLTRKQYMEVSRQADALGKEGLHEKAIALYLDVLKRGFAEDRDTLEAGAYGLIAYHFYMKGDYKSSREWELKRLDRFGPGKDNRRLIDTTRAVLRTYHNFPEDCAEVIKLLDDFFEKVPEPNGPGGGPLEKEFAVNYEDCGNKERYVELLEAEVARLAKPEAFPRLPVERRKELWRADLETLFGEYKRRGDFERCRRILDVLRNEFPEQTQAIEWLEKQLQHAERQKR